MKFIAGTNWSVVYPVSVTWKSTCTGSSGTGDLTSDGDSEIFNVTSDACPTYISLSGVTTGNVTLRYEPVGEIDGLTAKQKDRSSF
jgi:hypothetical protein